MRTHKVMPGETLEKISEAYYRSPEFDQYIFNHNTHVIQNPNRLDAGQVIVIPHIPVTSQLVAMMDDISDE